MKRLHIFLLVIFLSSKIFSEHLLQISTVGRVYNYEIGDTFEYNIIQPFSAPDLYTMQIVIGKSYSNDSYIYTFKRFQIYSGQNAYSIDTFQLLPGDTNALIAPDLPSTPCTPGYDTATNHEQVIDTSVICSSPIKSNYFATVGLPTNQTFSLTFLEGIGLVEDYQSCYADPYQTGHLATVMEYFSNLVYAHKVNGIICGTPEFPLALSVNEIAANNMQCKISPNPAHELCDLQMNDNGEIYSASILDITGREVIPLFTDQRISTFHFSTGILPPGLYFVRVTDSQGCSSVNKLVKK